MNWDRIEGNWKQMKGKVKEQWGKLTDDDIDVIAGKRDQLVGKIQEQYGISKDEAEKQVKTFRRRHARRRHDARLLIEIHREENTMRTTLKPIAALVLALGLGVGGRRARRRYDDPRRIQGRERSHRRAVQVRQGSLQRMSGNAKDICQAEAKGKQKIAKAELDARYKGTAKAREDARVARADAQYEVAKEKCDDLSGNAKDVCVKEAKAAQTRAKADAKADRKVSDARKDSNERTAEARRDASETKRDADYRAAAERCDRLAGDAKTACVADAKARFGKS